MLRDVVLHGRNDAVLALVAKLVATDRKLPMADFATSVIDLLWPVWRAAREAVLGARVVQLDALELPVLEDLPPLGVAERRSGGSRLGAADDIRCRQHGLLLVRTDQAAGGDESGEQDDRGGRVRLHDALGPGCGSRVMAPARDRDRQVASFSICT